MFEFRYTLVVTVDFEDVPHEREEVSWSDSRYGKSDVVQSFCVPLRVSV